MSGEIESKINEQVIPEEKLDSPKKLSYEELENVARQLSEQSKQLYTKLQEAQMFNTFKRMDYLFKIIDSTYPFSNKFVDKCAAEIQELMTIPDKESESDNK